MYPETQSLILKNKKQLHALLNNRIIQYVVDGLHPYSTVEEEGFKAMFDIFGLTVFSRRKLVSEIELLYNIAQPSTSTQPLPPIDISQPSTITQPPTSIEVAQPSPPANDPPVLLNTTPPIDKPSASNNNNFKENLADHGMNTSTPLPPMPKAADRCNVKRRKKKITSLVLSSTPVKEELQRIQTEKEEKIATQKERAEKRMQRKKEMETLKLVREEKKKKREEERNKKEIEKKKKAAEKLKKVKKPTLKNILKKRKPTPSSSSDESEIEINGQFSGYGKSESDLSSEEDMTEVCLICDERGKDEEWYLCDGCKRWCHAECSGWTKKEISETKYSCDFCIKRKSKCKKLLNF